MEQEKQKKMEDGWYSVSSLCKEISTKSHNKTLTQMEFVSLFEKLSDGIIDALHASRDYLREP